MYVLLATSWEAIDVAFDPWYTRCSPSTWSEADHIQKSKGLKEVMQETKGSKLQAKWLVNPIKLHTFYWDFREHFCCFSKNLDIVWLYGQWSIFTRIAQKGKRGKFKKYEYNLKYCITKQSGKHHCSHATKEFLPSIIQSFVNIPTIIPTID